MYGLVNDEHELFYIGCTAYPERRLKSHIADFQGVRALKMFNLGAFKNQAEARQSEETLVRHISMSCDLLINLNYNAGRHDEQRAPILKFRRALHFGSW